MYIRHIAELNKVHTFLHIHTCWNTLFTSVLIIPLYHLWLLTSPLETPWPAPHQWQLRKDSILNLTGIEMKYVLAYLDESTRLTITASSMLISYFQNMVTIYLQHSAVAMVVYNTNVIFNVRINHILLYRLNSNMLIFLIGQNFSPVQLQSLWGCLIEEFE